MSAVLQFEAVVYAGLRGAPVRIAPFDPSGIQPVTIDIHGWLGADTLTNHTWSTPAGIKIGDGLATKTVGTGAVKVPIASTPFVDPATGRTRIRAYYFVEEGVDPAPLLLVDHVLTVHLEAGLFADDRSVVTRLVEK